MTISTIKIKLFGKTETMFRAMKNGEVVQVACTKEEIESWILANS